MAFAVEKNDDGFEMEDFISDTKIMVFGVGGGGGNAVAHMVDSDVKDVEYVVANTDVCALRNKDGSKMKRIQLGRKTTKGRGAGNNPAIGKQSAEESREEIEAVMDGVSMIFVAAGMGGGTGTGAAPIVASVAKEKGILTVGVVTKPFAFEGATKMNQALKGIVEMKQYVDALIVIPNEKVKQMSNSKLTLSDAFKAVDNVLCKAVLGVITLLSVEGYVNVDFADVCMALKQSGIAHMAIGQGKGDNRVADAVNEVLNSPLLETSIWAQEGDLSISAFPKLSRWMSMIMLRRRSLRNLTRRLSIRQGLYSTNLWRTTKYLLSYLLRISSREVPHSMITLRNRLSRRNPPSLLPQPIHTLKAGVSTARQTWIVY